MFGLKQAGLSLQVLDLSQSGTFQHHTICSWSQLSDQIQFDTFQHHTMCSCSQRPDLSESHACTVMSVSVHGCTAMLQWHHFRQCRVCQSRNKYLPHPYRVCNTGCVLIKISYLHHYQQHPHSLIELEHRLHAICSGDVSMCIPTILDVQSNSDSVYMYLPLLPTIFIPGTYPSSMSSLRQSISGLPDTSNLTFYKENIMPCPRLPAPSSFYWKNLKRCCC